MFQGVVDDEKRAELGMHYTSVPNIMKVIQPLFLDELYAEFEKAKGSEAKLNKLLSATSRLRCEKYIEGKNKNDFTNPVYTLHLTGPEEYTLSIFAKPDKDATSYPALSSRSDFPFLLSAKQAEKIMKDPGDMIKKPPQPPSTPEKEGEKK